VGKVKFGGRQTDNPKLQTLFLQGSSEKKGVVEKPPVEGKIGRGILSSEAGGFKRTKKASI